jgi:hypothetical protein
MNLKQMRVSLIIYVLLSVYLYLTAIPFEVIVFFLLKRSKMVKPFLIYSIRVYMTVYHSVSTNQIFVE